MKNNNFFPKQFKTRVVSYLLFSLFLLPAFSRAQILDTSFILSEQIVQVKTKQPGKFNWHSESSINPIHQNNWLVPVVAVSYSGVTYLCYRRLDTRIQKFSQENKNRFQTFISNSVSCLGLGRVQSIGLGASTIVVFAAKNKKLQQTVIIWAGSLLINSIVTDQLKVSFQRHRPNSGDPYNSLDWRKGPKLNKSFPSAHTSNAFTTATVFATQYKTTKWVPPVAYTLASLVGLSRIYDNAHWASDVLAGAAVGFLSAKAMNSFYKLAKRKILFLPQVGISYSSLSLVCQF
jgi:membrane-associated phospholipid phosphatase